MDNKQIVLKINNKGSCSKKEKDYIYKHILENICANEQYLEEYQGSLLLKYEGTPIGKCFLENDLFQVKLFDKIEKFFEDKQLSKKIQDKFNKIIAEETTNNPFKQSNLMEKVVVAKQKQNGYSFEYALVKALMTKYPNYWIDENSNYKNLKTNFDAVLPQEQQMFEKSAFLAVKEICIPQINLLENVKIIAQNDSEGVKGDVRDIILEQGIVQIGFSCKNNNESSKHSRISPRLNFVKDWLKKEDSSSEYKQEIEEVFNNLKPHVKKLWEEVCTEEEKASRYYLPIMTAFKKEIENQLKDVGSIENLIKYVIGEQDYFKVIKYDNKQKVVIKAFNFNGTIPNVEKTIHPTKLEKSEITGLKNNTLILTFDNNWALSFRIHNADKEVENSFKFDVKITNTPEIFSKTLDID